MTLPTSFSRTKEKRPDFAVKVSAKSEEQHIVHVEFQTKSDANMHKREYGYYGDFMWAYDLEVIQYVIYLGSGKHNMKSEIRHKNLDFRYTIISLNEIDAEIFLASENPHEVILAVLCNYNRIEAPKIIQKILERKSREASGYSNSRFKLMDLESAFSNLSKETFDPVYLSLILVGITSCVELAVRHGIRDLIDYGSPYIDRINDLRLEKQFDIEIIKSFRDQKITIGEFIAYTLPISSFDQIEMNFSILIDKKLGNLMSEIKEHTESLDGLVGIGSNEEVKELSSIITEPNLVKTSIGRLFYHRHIIAHEASFNQISVSELQDFFKNVSLFINFLEELIQQTLYPNIPRSSFGLSVYAMQEAGKKLTASEDSYKKLTRLVKKLYSKDTYLLGKMLKLPRIVTSISISAS